MRFDSVDPLAADLETMVAIAAAGVPGRRPFLLAHSMGSLVGLHYALDHQDELSGIVLSGALASPEQGPHMLFAIRAAAKVAPGLGVFKVDSETISRDPEVVRAYDEDPLNFHGSLPAATVAALQRTGLTFPDRLPELTLPLLILHGADDRLTPPDGSEVVNELAASNDKTLRLYDGLRHEILNEPEGPEIVAEIVAWLDERSGN
jgi:alpha-beta hydrolase superfamily lysophospholipase